MAGKEGTIPRLPENVADGLYRRGTEPLAMCLARFRWITPDRVSLAGFLAGGVAAPVCILTQPLWTAGILFALGDFFDYLDGDLARRQGRASKEGAIFDATLDRYTDFLVIGALTYLTAVVLDPYPDLVIGRLSFFSSEAALVLGFAALLGATLTPYVRAKAEAELPGYHWQPGSAEPHPGGRTHRGPARLDIGCHCCGC